MIGVSITDKKVAANLRSLQRFAKTAPRKRLLDIGNELLRLSQREVPHDKGTLQNSGTVEAVGGDILVGYHTPYAHRLHEHPEYRFQKGRKGKYLTDPLYKNAKVFERHLAGDLKNDIRRAIK